MDRNIHRVVHNQRGRKFVILGLQFSVINIKRSFSMNWSQIEGNWKQLKGQAQQQWGKLTDDDLDIIDGKREELVGKVQERYGISKEQAEQEVNEFSSRC